MKSFEQRVTEAQEKWLAKYLLANMQPVGDMIGTKSSEVAHFIIQGLQMLEADERVREAEYNLHRE